MEEVEVGMEERAVEMVEDEEELLGEREERAASWVVKG